LACRSPVGLPVAGLHSGEAGLKGTGFRGALSTLRANLTSSDGDGRRTPCGHRRTVGHRRMAGGKRKARDKMVLHSSRTADTGRVPRNRLAVEDYTGAPHRAGAEAAPAGQPPRLSLTAARVPQWPTTIVAWCFSLSCHGISGVPSARPLVLVMKEVRGFKGVVKLMDVRVHALSLAGRTWGGTRPRCT
jgi:hypothetical protein